MAKYNEILVGRFNRFLQRFLSMKGDPPCPQLAGEITPQFQIDDAQNLENRFPAGWRSYALGVVSPAVAAAFSAVRLFNPIGSGVVVVVEKVTVAEILADNPLLTRGPVPGASFAGPLTGAIRDQRMGPAAGSTAVVSAGSNAATSGAPFWLGRSSATAILLDVILNEHQEIVVMPSDQITMWGAVLNQALQVSIWWRERALEEGELT